MILADSVGLSAETDLLDVRDACQRDPKALINQIRFFDPSQADSDAPAWVEFKMFPPDNWVAPIKTLPHGEWRFDETVGAEDWFWQSLFIDWVHDPKNKKMLVLKARQLGITLLACAYSLWLMLFRPGSVCVAYSYNLVEAQKLAVAVWAMFGSLPDLLKANVVVLTPSKAEEPTEWIKLRHPDGRISSFQALPATERHGHGARVTFAIMDEVAYMEYARRIYTAINPATSRGKAKLLMVSTAFGVSNIETGEGSYFHHLYATRLEKKLAYRFLPWNMEPSRDYDWYANEAMKLDDVERNQQYPLTEYDAFMLSGLNYFDRDSLDFYRSETIEPIMVGQFAVAGRRKARFMNFPEGTIKVYEQPHPQGEYVIAVDTATGRGTDYTVATVFDLLSGAIVASLRAKMEAPRAALQIHYLGKWYNRAKIGVERQGGFGESIIFALRDGNNNLPTYGNLYQDKAWTSQSKKLSDQYGIPMGPQKRATVLDTLKDYMRMRLFPWLPADYIAELSTFIYADTNPSPRAQDGHNDDCVMSLAIAAFMYNQLGDRPERPRTSSKRKREYVPPPTRSGV
jgi:hypothetical protein